MVFYDCCPQSPYPTLLYSISFQRSSDYYTFKLVLPSVVLTVLSFIAFFMDPDPGERLGFGITMILAMLASDITASGMMPVCNEKTFMDYLSQVCMLFGCLSLVETGVVLFLFYQKADDWSGVVSADGVMRLLRLACGKKSALDQVSPGYGTSDAECSTRPKIAVVLDMSDDLALRLTMYQQIFFVLDQVG